MSERPLVSPTVGRIVHYGGKNPLFSALAPIAAIVTFVSDDDHVELTTFPPRAAPGAEVHVPFAMYLKEGHWSYPPMAVPMKKVAEPSEDKPL
jgi:hypothetical protein